MSPRAKKAKEKMSDECRCGHARERHDHGAAYLQPCQVSGCRCRHFHKLKLLTERDYRELLKGAKGK